MKQLIQAVEKWVGICMKDYPDSRAVPDDLVGLCLELSKVQVNSEGIPVPCVECVGLQEAADHEGSMAAMLAEALEKVITDESTRVRGSFDDDEHPIETLAATTAFHALSAYTVAQEQFSKRRSLPLPDDREDDDIPF